MGENSKAVSLFSIWYPRYGIIIIHGNMTTNEREKQKNNEYNMN